MQVKDVMTPTTTTIPSDAPVMAAATLMAEEDIGAVPVAENDRLVGMITDRDIVLRVLVNDMPADSTPVRDVMSRTLRYCFDDEACRDVAESMAKLRVLRMPVVDRDKRLVGIITGGDLQARASEPAANNIDGRGSQLDEAVKETFPASDPIAPGDNH